MPEFARIDKYPQFCGFTLEASAANVETEIRLTLPKYRFGTGASQSSVICWEFLKIEIFPLLELTHAAGCDFTVSASTASHAGLAGDDFTSGINEGDNIFFHHGFYPEGQITFPYHQHYQSGTAPFVCDLQFNDGRGVPVASDYIYIQLDSTNYNNALWIDGRIWYRFIKLSLAEYIGLLQQQAVPETQPVI